MDRQELAEDPRGQVTAIQEFGPGFGPSSESKSITLRHTPLPAPASQSSLLERVYLASSHSITLRHNRLSIDYGSGGWGFKSLRAHQRFNMLCNSTTSQRMLCRSSVEHSPILLREDVSIDD